ncbi:MAG: hypothetical protein Q9217_003886 [Psora testacea]
MAMPSSRESSSTRAHPSPAPSTTPSTASRADKPESIPTAYVSDKADDSSKLKTFLSILRKFIGVSDIASVRFSLPAQLLEPTPNLEYWNYLDRPETFIGIGDSDDALGRMLEVLRFWFTKDLKYVKGKPCKPYNSTLGEFFRCNWEVKDTAPPILGETHKESATHHIDTADKPVRVSYITEQTSHHPPVSAFYIECPVKGLSARGFDQLSAKFTGTSIRVTPGAHNLGIFINIKNRDNEEYQLTHPVANLSGIIRGSLSISVADTCFVTCPKTKMKVILQYLEEGWLGKTQNKVHGLIFSYDPSNDTKTRIKDVPEKDVLARLEGCWHEEIFYTLNGSKSPSTLIDLRPLFPLPKLTPPLSQQLPNESQRFWQAVTTSIKEKRYTEATKLKQELEERQREKAKDRELKGEQWRPRFFQQTINGSGRPELSEEGRRALENLQAEEWSLQETVEVPAILALRRDPRLHKLPPYLSTLLIIVGIVWLLLLPLNEYSRHTYISENALLPGQVHTYFGGSEQQIFNAYKYEIQDVARKAQEDISTKLGEIFESAGLRPARQKYEYQAAGETYRGENVYAILRAPRGDATEAIALVAAWTNMEGQLNVNGVALALSLARYFKRWSLWSKDIVVLITSDSRAGPQAWVDAYHDEHVPASVSPLPIKSGALQGAVVVDNALDHHFDSLHIVYDGINGQLPNLDLFNTAVSIASGQMGIGVALQRMWKHDDSYPERLRTMLRGMVSQGLGHSSGPHSSFIPYHIDAITLQAVGDGPQDEMAMGRVVESLFRSLNNLLEHFHQSFFLYLLMQADRFVSIGTYLPSAMLVAVNFSVMAIALWIRSGRPPAPKIASTMPGKDEKPDIEFVEGNGVTAIAPKETLTIQERELFIPLAFVTLVHFLGIIPLYTFNNFSGEILTDQFVMWFTALNLFLPAGLAMGLKPQLTDQHRILIQCFSLLLLGMFLATLATLNFSLSLFVGLLSTPLSFIGPQFSRADEKSASQSRTRKVLSTMILQVLSPPIILWTVSWFSGTGVRETLVEAAFGWKVNGLWTQVVVWCVWCPAWLIGSVLASPNM